MGYQLRKKLASCVDSLAEGIYLHSFDPIMFLHQIKHRIRPRSHCSVSVMISFCCIDATHSNSSISVQKRTEKNPFCPFTLILLITNTTLRRFCEAHCWTLERFQKPPFLWISTFYSVFENLRFCGILCRSMWTLSKKRRFFSPFLYKNGAVWKGP